MTRLCAADVLPIGAELSEYDNKLQKITGANLLQIAASAARIDLTMVKEPGKYKIAVIPVTCGQGIIQGFSHAVAEIVSYLGFSTFVTENTDVAGLAEALEKKADVLMLADDNRFIAVNTLTRQVVDNSQATGKGFVAALEFMAGGLENKEVLVLGAGPVGQSAINELLLRKANVALYDINEKVAQAVYHNFIHHGNTFKLEKDLNEALSKHRLIIDACPAKAFIKPEDLHKEALIAAPGVPLGLAHQCFPEFSQRLVHDPLQIGVATMALQAVYASNFEALG